MINIVKVTAIPYTDAMLLEVRNPSTSAMQPNISIQFTRGMYICPFWCDEVWSIAMRGE